MTATAKLASALPQVSTAAPMEDTAASVQELTIASNQIAANAGRVNPYAVRNELLVERAKERVRYKNGYTLPTSAEVLLANADKRDYNHRRTLARNIVKATGKARPSDTDAHHIVAARHQDARLARLKLFSVGVGINDGDNGVFLPNKGVGLPEHPKAPHHRTNHRLRYHLSVYRELQFAGDTAQARGALRLLKRRILDGVLVLNVESE